MAGLHDLAADPFLFGRQGDRRVGTPAATWPRTHRSPLPARSTSRRESSPPTSLVRRGSPATPARRGIRRRRASSGVDHLRNGVLRFEHHAGCQVRDPRDQFDLQCGDLLGGERVRVAGPQELTQRIAVVDGQDRESSVLVGEVRDHSGGRTTGSSHAPWSQSSWIHVNASSKQGGVHALGVVELAGQVVQEHHVRRRAGDRRVIPLRHEYRLAVACGEQLVELLVVAPVALHDEPVAGIETEVVHLLQVRGTVPAVVTVRGPTGPRSSRHVDLVQDQPLGVDRRCEHVVHVAVGLSPAPQLLLHLRRFDQADRVLTFGRRRPDRELERTVGCFWNGHGDRRSPGACRRCGASARTRSSGSVRTSCRRRSRAPAPDSGTIAVSWSSSRALCDSPGCSSTTAKLKKSHPAFVGVTSIRTDPSEERAR